MRIARFLLEVGGGIFVLLGLLHALYTFLDIRRPRRLVPQDPAVALGMTTTPLRLSRGGTTMWRAWVGFNFSHGVGVVLFGVLCTGAGVGLGGYGRTRLGPACLGGHFRYLSGNQRPILVLDPDRGNRGGFVLPAGGVADVRDGWRLRSFERSRCHRRMTAWSTAPRVREFWRRLLLAAAPISTSRSEGCGSSVQLQRFDGYASPCIALGNTRRKVQSR